MNVLMLGWEFPPILNGGLGVACYGLTQELKEMVDLTLIIPQSDPKFGINKMNLIGLNTKQINSELREIWKKGYYAKNVYHTNHSLLPYQKAEKQISLEQQAIEQQYLSHTNCDEMVYGGSDNLYGDDVFEKVNEFAEHSCLIAKEQDFDVIHAHDWMTFPAAMLLKEKYNKPLVLHVHSLETDRSGEESRGGTYDIEKKAMLVADAVVPVSNYTGDMIVKHYDIPRDKIYPIHNGIGEVKTFKKDNQLKEKIVLFLGRITFQKGPEYYFEVAKKVIKSVPNVRFVMAGTGDRMQGLIEAAANEGIGSKFHFTGFLTRQQVHSMFAMSDVYFMPSVSEPFGLSATEAAQFGVPCVISKQSGVAEVLKSSLKADFWDIDKMANHIISLLKYDTLKKEIVNNAHEDLKSINWEGASEKIVDIYKRIINN